MAFVSDRKESVQITFSIEGSEECLLHADKLYRYLRQCREETGCRLVEQCYRHSDTPSKFWLAFANKKFMNRTLVS